MATLIILINSVEPGVHEGKYILILLVLLQEQIDLLIHSLRNLSMKEILGSGGEGGGRERKLITFSVNRRRRIKESMRLIAQLICISITILKFKYIFNSINPAFSMKIEMYLKI